MFNGTGTGSFSCFKPHGNSSDILPATLWGGCPVGFLLLSHPPSLPPLFTSVNNGCLDAWRGGSWLGGRDCWPWEYYSVKGQAGCLASRGSPPGTQPPFSDAVVNKSLASSSCPLDKLYNASSSQSCKPPVVCPSTQTQDPFRHLGGEGH